MSDSRSVGKTRGEMRADEAAARDAYAAVALCALCPDFRHEGTALECRDAGVAHRAAHHPGRVSVSRRRLSELQRERKEADAVAQRQRIEERYA